jgi:hypothetical protein
MSHAVRLSRNILTHLCSRFRATPFATSGTHSLCSAVGSCVRTFTASCKPLSLTFADTVDTLPPLLPPGSTPPKEQANYERWSLVFFSRPQEDAVLHALTDESTIIADAVARSEDPGKFNTGQTAAAWFARRIRNQRIANRTVCRLSPL